VLVRVIFVNKIDDVFEDERGTSFILIKSSHKVNQLLPAIKYIKYIQKCWNIMKNQNNLDHVCN